MCSFTCQSQLVAHQLPDNRNDESREKRRRHNHSRFHGGFSLVLSRSSGPNGAATCRLPYMQPAAYRRPWPKHPRTPQSWIRCHMHACGIKTRPHYPKRTKTASVNEAAVSGTHSTQRSEWGIWRFYRNWRFSEIFSLVTAHINGDLKTPVSSSHSRKATSVLNIE